MTQHLHSEFVPGCYRCDLSRDEAFVPPHECDSGYFDGVACPEPCGAMHTYCSICQETQDVCYLDD